MGSIPTRPTINIVVWGRNAKVLVHNENDLYEWDLKYPINIPIEVGKCTYILIEAEGYHDWEEAFCPQKAERIDVEISLVPKLSPPIKKQ